MQLASYTACVQAVAAVHRDALVREHNTVNSKHMLHFMRKLILNMQRGATSTPVTKRTQPENLMAENHANV